MKGSLLLYFLLLPFLSFSQGFKIDWQTCYGGTTHDQAYDIVMLEDGYLMTGIVKRDGADELLLVKLDFEGNIIWEKEYGGSKGDAGIRLLLTTDGNYFLVGGTASSDGDIENDPYVNGLWDYWILKIDLNGDIIWSKIYGGMANDTMWDAVLTSDGGLILTGWVESSDGDITVHYGWYDIWILKLNSQGEKVWDYTIGTPSFDFAGGIIETSDKGFLVTSSSEGYSGGNIDCDAINEYSEATIFKLDSLSNFQWQQCYGGTSHESVTDLIEISDGYILTCITYSGDGDVTGGGYHPGTSGGANSSDIWILKLDFFGNIIWQKCYGGSGDDTPDKIFKTDDNNYLIFGNTSSHDGDVIGNHSNGGYNDIWIFKINDSGELLWQQCFGGNGDETLEAGVIKVSDYNFIIATTIYGNSTGQITCQESFDNDQIWIISVSDTTVGLNDITNVDNFIKVYPNPATEYLVFEGSNNKPLNLLITDIYGKVIKQEIIGDRFIWNTEGVNPGVYFYVAGDGSTTVNGKFVIMN
jgi:hypothetical protein